MPFSRPAQRSRRYGLQICQVAFATFYTGGFSSFVASTAAPIATGWSEPVPGRDFHPLWISAFSRRTEIFGLASFFAAGSWEGRRRMNVATPTAPTGCVLHIG